MKLGLAGWTDYCRYPSGDFGPRISLITYTTRSANLMLRALGLSMYLVCLGLDAGAHFSIPYSVRRLIMDWFGGRIDYHSNSVGWIRGFQDDEDRFRFCIRMLCGSMANPMALNYVNDTIPGDNPSVAYATVYPLCMFLRVIIAQVLLMFLLN
ncbi:hypothetical protein NXV05_21280 [Parabacteroides johnsonii]|nr:hypothetical protein [Parabacteroides johnsonii]